tara:strand:- start:521 stop:1393 length:873 start_codon:yes stop_codon:yes gene_type:complete
VFKGNYKAWGISIGLHVVVICLISRQTIEIAQPPTGKVIKAYVMVDLATLPSNKNSKQPSASFSENNTELDASELTTKPLKERDFENDKQLESDLPDGAITANGNTATSTDGKKHNVDKVVIDNIKSKVNSKAKQQSFKKLNPYALIPQFSTSNKAIVSFDYTQIATLPNRKNHQQITVSIEHSSDLKSVILWQNADGGKRTEMYKGMCYDIDFNGVMGKVGLPQGSPRPCKNNDAILFDKIMDKWNVKSKFGSGFIIYETYVFAIKRLLRLTLKYTARSLQLKSGFQSG